MKDNKGFSLVEVLIAILIITLIAGFGLSKTQAIFGYNAQEAYKKVVSTLTTGKVKTLSKSQLVSSSTSVKTGTTVTPEVASDGVYVEFYIKDKAIYTKTYVRGVAENPDGEKIGGKGVVITYTLDDSSSGTLQDGEGNGIMFSFDRSTGAFLPYINGKYITEMKISGGSRTYTIKLMPKTGKVVKSGRM